MTEGGVSLSVDGHADRDQLAALLHQLDCGCGDYTAEGDGADPYYPHNADIVLASDWLRERDRAVRRAALLEAADELQADYDYTLSVDSGYSPSYWDGLGHAIDVVRARVEP